MLAMSWQEGARDSGQADHDRHTETSSENMLVTAGNSGENDNAGYNNKAARHPVAAGARNGTTHDGCLYGAVAYADRGRGPGR